MVHGRGYSQGNGYAYGYAYGYGFANRGTAVHESAMDMHDDGVDGDAGAGGYYNENDDECVAVVPHNRHPCLRLSIMAIPAWWCGGGVGTADHAGTHDSAHGA